LLGSVIGFTFITAQPAFAQIDKAPNTQDTIPQLPTRSLVNPQEKIANIEAAIRAYNSGDFFKASSLAKTAYNAGSMDGAVLLGHMSRKGEIGPINYTEARQRQAFSRAQQIKAAPKP